MANIQNLNEVSIIQDGDIWIIDDGIETQTATVAQLRNYLQSTLNIPVSIDDISGLGGCFKR